MPHICVSESGQPIRRQAIIYTNAELLSIGPLGKNFSEILNKIYFISFTEKYLKKSYAKWRLFVHEEMS